MPRQKLSIISALVLAFIVAVPALAGFHLTQAVAVASPPRQFNTWSAPDSVNIVFASPAVALTLFPLSVGCEASTEPSVMLLQDEAKINLNQPASCFSLSLQPFRQSYALNPWVVTEPPWENIVIDSQQYSFVSHHVSAVSDFPFLAMTLVPMPPVVRAMLLNSLLAVLILLVFGYVSLIRSKASLSLLCVRRC